MTTKMQHRRGTASQWSSANPVLAAGELGVVTDTARVKCGNGSSAWNDLPFLTLADGEVTTAKIADGAVTRDKLPSGTGSPEGVVTAAPGSTWLQTDATTDVKGWIRWLKATGTGNTGWVAGAEADTGPRVVTVDGAGWSGALLLRRIGRQVQVYTNSSNFPIMPASGTQIMTLPIGFTADTGACPGVAYNMWTGAIVGVVVTGTSNLSVSVAGDLLATRGLAPLLTFISTADWPTSLPGSAA